MNPLESLTTDELMDAMCDFAADKAREMMLAVGGGDPSEVEMEAFKAGVVWGARMITTSLYEALGEPLERLMEEAKGR